MPCAIASTGNICSRLELADPGFDASVLCEFRKRLVQGGAEYLLPDALLALCKERGWLKARERQRTDSTHVLAKIRAMNRYMRVGEAMRFVPGSLAVVAPEWLLAHSDAEWVEHYGHRIVESRLPKSEGDRLALAEVMGEDGWKVLSAVFDPSAPSWLREIPAVQVLRQIWLQNYWMEDGHLRWRDADTIPPATLAHQLAVRDSKPTWAKSAAPSGPDTKSTSPKPAHRRFLT